MQIKIEENKTKKIIFSTLETTSESDVCTVASLPLAEEQS